MTGLSRCVTYIFTYSHFSRGLLLDAQAVLAVLAVSDGWVLDGTDGVQVIVLNVTVLPSVRHLHQILASLLAPSL